MLVETDDLVTATMIAERAQVVPTAVANWQARTGNGFPLPVVSLPRTKLWLWPDVEAWLWVTGRHPTRRNDGSTD